MKERYFPSCIGYAVENGPIDADDHMAWCINMAKWYKFQGFSEEKANMQISKLAANCDDELDDDLIIQFVHTAWQSDIPLDCKELMGCNSFLRGCSNEKCENYVRPLVPIGDQPTAVRVYLSDDPGSIGIDEDGAIKKVKQVEKKSGETVKVLEWVSDCAVFIHTETIAEDETEFVFEGTGAADKRHVRFVMAAGDCPDSRKLKAMLTNAFGAANRLGELTFDTIQKITRNTIKRRRLTAPAWVDGKPMVPGVDLAEDIEFKLLDVIPALVYDGDMDAAKKTLGTMLDIPGPTPILVVGILGAPLYARCYNNERFGIALWGRSGSLKTSLVRKAMCIYGEGYHDEANLLKHGKSSSTSVGAMEYMAGAGILPEPWDNVKSVNPKDTMEYIGTVHAVIEGKEKARGKKEGGLRKSKQFYTTPIITGEIKPDEASTSARIFNLKWTEPKSKKEIDYVAKHIHDLPIVGYHWLRYLALNDLKLDGFEEKRTKKTDEFNQKEYVNSGRLATIYTLLRVTWAALLESPFGDVFEPRTERFLTELDRCAEEQGVMVSEETEVAKFVSGVTAILSTQPHLIQENEHQKPDEYGKSMYKDVIGRWVGDKRVEDDETRDVFLVPAPTLAALKRMGIFTQIPSEGSITDALYQAGYLILDDKNRRKVQYRLNGKRPVGWQIKGEIINPPESKAKTGRDSEQATL